MVQCIYWALFCKHSNKMIHFYVILLDKLYMTFYSTFKTFEVDFNKCKRKILLMFLSYYKHCCIYFEDINLCNNIANWFFIKTLKTKQKDSCGQTWNE